MEWFAFLLVALVVYVLLSKRASTPAGVWPFYPKRPLSEVEQLFYWRFVQALPEHVVIPQVQLSRFLGVKRGHKFHQWNNRINRMSVDYLVCSKDFSVVAAVELDDSTHRRRDRVRADSKKDKALQDAGVRLIRWPVRPLPEIVEIHSAFASAPVDLASMPQRRDPVLDGHNASSS